MTKRVRLSEVAEFINGRAFKPEEWETEGLPIIRIQNLTGSTDIVNYYSGDVETKYLVKDDDILISWSASLGVYRWQGGDAILNQHIFKAELKEYLIDKNYFYYVAQNALAEMERHIHGATMQHITRDPFLAIEIPLPPLSEQKRIASLLARADRLRSLRRTGRALGESLLQSVFLEMFGDPKVNSKKFDIESLEDVLASSPQNGLYVPEEQYEPKDSKNGVEMVHMSDAFYGKVERGSIKRVNISEKDIQKYSITHNDLLVARRSLNFEGAAKPCLIPESDEPLVFESSMIRVTADQSKLLPIYLYYYLSNERAKQAHVLKYVTKSTISGINQDGLKQIEVILPPLALQEEFASVVARVEGLRGRMSEAERQGEGLFESLLAESFA